jgi:hypothetical protein
MSLVRADPPPAPIRRAEQLMKSGFAKGAVDFAPAKMRSELAVSGSGTA